MVAVSERILQITNTTALFFSSYYSLIYVVTEYHCPNAQFTSSNRGKQKKQK